MQLQLIPWCKINWCPKYSFMYTHTHMHKEISLQPTYPQKITHTHTHARARVHATDYALHSTQGDFLMFVVTSWLDQNPVRIWKWQDSGSFFILLTARPMLHLSDSLHGCYKNFYFFLGGGAKLLVPLYRDTPGCHDSALKYTTPTPCFG